MHRCRGIMPTLIRAKVLQAILLLLLLLQVAHRAASAQGDRQEMMDELSDLSCALDSNETLKLAFYNSVRRRYGDSGNPDDDDMYSQIRLGVASNVRCYGSCKGATLLTTTWCVNVYSPGEPVEVCLNSSGTVSETRAAKLLGLKDLLHMSSCGSTAGCLSVDAPYYLNNAYLMCASRTSTCTKRTFVELTIQVPKEDLKILEFPGPTQMANIGERLVLRCEATAGYQFAYLQWSRSRDNFTYLPIYEDPLCDSRVTNCPRDNTPDAVVARRSNVRMYNVFRMFGECEDVAMNMTSYLVFDNVTTEDAGDYVCVATNYLTAGLTVSQSIHIVVVASAYGSYNNELEVAPNSYAAAGISIANWCPPCHTASIAAIIFAQVIYLILNF